MRAEEARAIATEHKPKMAEKNKKKIERQINNLYAQIKKSAKKGHFSTHIDWRELTDLSIVEQKLIQDGYSINRNYPFLNVTWGE